MRFVMVLDVFVQLQLSLARLAITKRVGNTKVFFFRPGNLAGESLDTSIAESGEIRRLNI